MQNVFIAAATAVTGGEESESQEVGTFFCDWFFPVSCESSWESSFKYIFTRLFSTDAHFSEFVICNLFSGQISLGG